MMGETDIIKYSTVGAFQNVLNHASAIHTTPAKMGRYSAFMKAIFY